MHPQSPRRPDSADGETLPINSTKTSLAPSGAAMSGFVIEPKPAAHFGVGAVGKLPGIVRGIGAHHVVVVTDAALAVSPVLAQVLDILLDAGLPCHVFSGVHPNPTTDDRAAGAAAVAGAAGVAAAAEAAAAVAATLKASAPA